MAARPTERAKVRRHAFLAGLTPWQCLALVLLALALAGSGQTGTAEDRVEANPGPATAPAVSGVKVAAIVTPNVLYYHPDATGNLVALTDSSRQVVWRADVRPFGQGSASSADHPLRFVNQPLEGAIGDQGGLYDLGARFYDPLAGRFLSPDPLSLTAINLEEPQRFNRYAYGLNNPYRYIDPTGGDAIETIKEIFGIGDAKAYTQLDKNKVSTDGKTTGVSVSVGPVTVGTDVKGDGKPVMKVEVGKGIEGGSKKLNLKGEIKPSVGVELRGDVKSDDYSIAKIVAFIKVKFALKYGSTGVEVDAKKEASIGTLRLGKFVRQGFETQRQALEQVTAPENQR